MRKRKATGQKTPSRYWDDSDWAIANVQTLSDNYPNQWVAIFNKQVIANNKELGPVVKQARNLGAKDAVFKFVEQGINVYRYSVQI
jgi:hypothetical protein